MKLGEQESCLCVAITIYFMDFVLCFIYSISVRFNQLSKRGEVVAS